MKSYLVVLLFTLTASTFPDDFVKLAKCVLSSQTVYEVVPKVIEAVKNGDYFTLLQIALTEVPKVKEEVMECMDEPTLNMKCDFLELAKCGLQCQFKVVIKRDLCVSNCKTTYCH